MDVNEQARKELLEEVNGISDEDLNRKLADNKWSIKQVLEHLYLMEGVITKTIEGQLDNGKSVNAEEKPIELTQNRAKKVEAPDFARPSESYATLDELKQKLDKTHKQLMDLEKTSNKKLMSERGYPHPLFSDLSLKQWIPFVGYHELRHTEQIKEIKSALGIK